MFRKLAFIFLGLLLSIPLHAQEADDCRDVVQTMYVAYYGRPGDEGGIHFWAKKLDEVDGELSEIIDSFGNSAEFQDRFGDLDSETLVINIYDQLLGREPDPAGLAFYVDKFEAGEFSLASIALRVNDGVENEDVATVANKLAVANEFTESYLVANVAYAGNQIEDAKLLIADVDSTSASVTAAIDDLPFLLDTFPAGGAERVRLETQYGDIVLEMYREEAPLTVANFLSYLDSDFYDGTVFHRLAAGFVLQGGGFVYAPDAACPLVQKETMSPIVNEASNGLSNLTYTVAMARTNDPDSATSQFYINLKDNTSLDFSANSAGYAVFATVIEGQEVVELLATAPTITLQCLGSSEVPQFVLEVTTARRAP
jgi:cyclophilin family peptidyl-prolyl cis-trans isomerase